MLNYPSLSYPHNELHRVPADLSKFWVITIISNPCRYKRRYELYFRFAEMCHDAGVNLITVEQAFGDRQFMVTQPNNKYHLQVRSVEELWHKENMINLGVKHACAIAPGGVREVAWVDADCRPVRPYRDWFEETWHQLQHYEFVQMWEWLIDLDTHFSPISTPQPGFMSTYIRYGTPTPEVFKELQETIKAPCTCHCHHHHKHHHHHHYPHTPGGPKLFGRPGLAWAANLDAFNKVGGLIDFSILGAGDWHMAHALIGSINVASQEFIQNGVISNYAKKMLEWQNKAERWIKRDVGFVPGTVYHDFHGNKVNRGYGTRGQILIRNKYDPDLDIKPDGQGLLQLETWEPRQLRLRDEIRAYFRARNEDQVP